VVAEFPGVVLVNEVRQGASYARTTGFGVSTGEIVVLCDDDVRMPADWIEKLIAPFSRSDVMVVTGNILPLGLDTPAQRLYESYSGSGREFEPRRVDDIWFESFRYRAVPTWELGVTANAAVRVTVLSDPRVGLLSGKIEAGMPACAGEGAYLFYRVLKAGYTIAYEPTAYVWRKNPRDMATLRRRIWDYSKGHVSYHLTTLFRDHDLRSLLTLGVHLPLWRVRQIARAAKTLLQGRRSEYPFSLIFIEIAGNLAGPMDYFRSLHHVRTDPSLQPRLSPAVQEKSGSNGSHRGHSSS
jgi:glycosyltransferase involved in cell wall biosynthesis